MHVPAGEGGVRREQARRHGAYVAAGGGQHGNGNSQRALAVAAQIMHGGDAGDVRSFALVEMRFGFVHGSTSFRVVKRR